MRPTQSVLRRSAGGCILLQRCGKRLFLSIRVRKSCEINAITFSTMKREVKSLKRELRALRNGHLSTSEVRLPLTLEEKHRHESNGHAEYFNRCEICVRVYSESCAFDFASVTFKGLRHCVNWQRTPMRMLLSSCSTQRSASEGLGTFSRSHASEISLLASEI